MTALVGDPGQIFQRYLGIDYSGAGTPESGQSGIRVYESFPGGEPGEIRPEKNGSRHWCRAGLAEWLASQLADPLPTLVGLDHGFSFPEAYFQRHALDGEWREFLRDFRAHWPTDQAGVTVRQVRNGTVGKGEARRGTARWRRVCETSCRAKSVFHFDVPGSVATSTHAGLPWLLKLALEVRALHFWPFDGWVVARGKSVVAEAYPSLWSREFPREGRTADQHDAYSLCRWMEKVDRERALQDLMEPPQEMWEDPVVIREGWILGVPFER